MIATGNARAAAFDLLTAGLTLAGARALRSQRDPGFGMRLAIAALSLHWLVIGVIHIVLAAMGHTPFLVGDEISYNGFATELSRAWLGTGPPVPLGDQYLNTPFSTLLAGAYTLGGDTPLAGLTIPLAFATWTPVLAHRLVADHGPWSDMRPARVAGILATVFPTTFLWSSFLLKDSSVTFGTIALIVTVLEVTDPSRSWQSRAGWAILGMGMVAWLYGVRGVELVPLAGGIVLWLLCRTRGRGWQVKLSAGVIIASAVAAFFVIPSLHDQLDRVPFRLAQHRVAGRVSARTAEPPEAPPYEATWQSTVAHVPQGLLLVMLRPLPSQVKDVPQLAGAVGNLVYLVLVAFAVAGAAVAWRAGWRDGVVLLAANVVLLWLVLAVSDGNAGTAWRHRDAVTPLLACLAGIAVSQMRLLDRIVDLRPAFPLWKTRELAE